MLSPLILPLAAIAPFLLWPVEIFLPYPHFVEELAKLFLVWNIEKSLPLSKKLLLAALIGLLFSLSEGVLYTLNIYPTLDTGLLLLRLLLPTALHVSTSLILCFSANINRKFFPLGLALSILIHYLFNTGPFR